MSEEVGARSIFVGRAPVDYRDLRMRQAMPAFRDACAGIKVALDPNGVIAPGRYGHRHAVTAPRFISCS
jgi:4-cresol dehydrogenase (hydroxylating) flavoprotein subunit